jgi:hypothetical protein
MAYVSYMQSIRIIAGATPTMTGQPICDVDFKIDPLVTQCYDDNSLSADEAGRFNIPDGTVNQSLCMGTVTVGNIFVITPANDIQITLINGTDQAPLIFKGGMTSVLNTVFTGILATNNSGLLVSGKYFVAGN